MTRILKAKIDVTKIDKTRIETRTYTDRGGVEVTQKLYPVDIVLIDVPTFIKDFDDAKLVKAGFMVQGQTKEDREAKTKGISLCDVMEYQKKEEKPKQVVEGVDYPENDIDSGDIPF